MMLFQAINFSIIMPSVEAQELEIPDWIKEHTKKWIDGSIDDITFVNSLEWLAANNIIQTPDLMSVDSDNEFELYKRDVKIPKWIKLTAGYWLEGKINDKTFLNAIIFLYKEEILQTPNIQVNLLFDEDDFLYVTFIKLPGSGDSTFIKLPNDKTILIDGGFGNSAPTIINFLQNKNVEKIDLMIATHDDGDHIGGLSKLLESPSPYNNHVNELWISPYFSSSDYWNKFFSNILNQETIKYSVAQADKNWEHGDDVSVQIISPSLSEISGGRHATPVNNNSLITRLEYGDIKFLFTGDATWKTEQWLLDDKKRLEQIDIDIMNAPHHGSAYSSGYKNIEFLEKTSPKVVIFSANIDNQHGHPEIDTIKRYLKLDKLKMFQTGIHGDVTIKTDGKECFIVLRNHQETCWDNPGSFYDASESIQVFGKGKDVVFRTDSHPNLDKPIKAGAISEEERLALDSIMVGEKFWLEKTTKFEIFTYTSKNVVEDVRLLIDAYDVDFLSQSYHPKNCLKEQNEVTLNEKYKIGILTGKNNQHVTSTFQIDKEWVNWLKDGVPGKNTISIEVAKGADDNCQWSTKINWGEIRAVQKPIIFLPGILGSEIVDADDGTIYWLGGTGIVQEQLEWVAIEGAAKTGEKFGEKLGEAIGARSGNPTVAILLRELMGEHGYANTKWWAETLNPFHTRVDKLTLNEDGETGKFHSKSGNILRSVVTTDVYGKFLDEFLPELGYYSEQNYEANKKKFEEENKITPFSKNNIRLYELPYDWRFDNENVVEKLSDTVNKIKHRHDIDKIIFVAHSMGGLISKDYVNKGGASNVEFLFTMGTPYHGSPKTYFMLDHGEDITGGFLGIKLLVPEQVKDLTLNMPSVYQLLPTQEYFDIFKEDTKINPQKKSVIKMINQNPGPVTIEEAYLNGPTKLGQDDFTKKALEWSNSIKNEFRGLDVTNQVFFAMGIGQKTLQSIEKIDDGKYDPYYSYDGDGTVPLISQYAKNDGVPEDNKRSFTSEHVKLVDHSDVKEFLLEKIMKAHNKNHKQSQIIDIEEKQEYSDCFNYDSSKSMDPMFDLITESYSENRSFDGFLAANVVLDVRACKKYVEYNTDDGYYAKAVWNLRTEHGNPLEKGTKVLIDLVRGLDSVQAIKVVSYIQDNDGNLVFPFLVDDLGQGHIHLKINKLGTTNGVYTGDGDLQKIEDPCTSKDIVPPLPAGWFILFPEAFGQNHSIEDPCPLEKSKEQLQSREIRVDKSYVTYFNDPECEKYAHWHLVYADTEKPVEEGTWIDLDDIGGYTAQHAIVNKDGKIVIGFDCIPGQAKSGEPRITPHSIDDYVPEGYPLYSYHGDGDQLKVERWPPPLWQEHLPNPGPIVYVDKCYTKYTVERSGYASWFFKYKNGTAVHEGYRVHLLGDHPATTTMIGEDGELRVDIRVPNGFRHTYNLIPSQFPLDNILFYGPGPALKMEFWQANEHIEEQTCP